MTEQLIYTYPFWRYHQNQTYPTIDNLSKSIESLVSKGEIQLPNLRNCQHIIIGSDYAGEKAEYQILSFLIADQDHLQNWSRAMHLLRDNQPLDRRTMGFKDLGDGIKYNALSNFFEASDKINGLCVVVAIHRSCKHLFDQTPLLEPWKKRTVYVKSLRITNFMNFFLGGLTKPKQDVTWITDQDEIVANSILSEAFLEMVTIVTQSYFPHSLKDITIATTASNNRENMELEDLTAIPDLLAGAFSEYFTFYYKNYPNYFAENTISVPNLESMSKKTRRILHFGSVSSNSLKKMILLITPEQNKEDFSIKYIKLDMKIN